MGVVCCLGDSHSAASKHWAEEKGRGRGGATERAWQEEKNLNHVLMDTLCQLSIFLNCNSYDTTHLTYTKKRKQVHIIIIKLIIRHSLRAGRS